VAEAGPGREAGQGGDHLVGEPAEGNDHPDLDQQCPLPYEKGRAGVALVGSGSVGRRGTTHGGAHVGARQLEAVAPVLAGGLVGVAGSVQCPEHPVTGAVTGEDPAGTVPPMGRRGQADDQEPGGGIAEAGHRSAPVGVVSVRRPLVDGDPLTPIDQSGACPTADDVGGDAGE
jgi:hypothetical protein